MEFYTGLTDLLPFRSLHYKPARGTSHPDHRDYNRWYESYETLCTVWYGFSTCVEIVDFCCQELGVPEPQVSSSLQYTEGGGMFRVQGRKRTPIILFPREGANGYIILHELAHYLEFLERGAGTYIAVYMNRPTHHSRQFKAILRRLMERFPALLTAEDSFAVWAPNNAQGTIASSD